MAGSAIGGIRETPEMIPKNLRAHYRLPTVLVIAYRRRVLNSPTGELWFGAHSRAAPEEMHAGGAAAAAGA